MPKVFVMCEGVHFYTWANVHVIPFEPRLWPVHPIYDSTDIVPGPPDLAASNLLTGGTPYP